jgi:hypothetical protein
VGKFQTRISNKNSKFRLIIYFLFQQRSKESDKMLRGSYKVWHCWHRNKREQFQKDLQQHSTLRIRIWDVVGCVTEEKFRRDNVTFARHFREVSGIKLKLEIKFNLNSVRNSRFSFLFFFEIFQHIAIKPSWRNYSKIYTLLLFLHVNCEPKRHVHRKTNSERSWNWWLFMIFLTSKMKTNRLCWKSDELD